MADDRDDLAGCDLEADAIKRQIRSGRIAERDALDVQRGEGFYRDRPLRLHPLGPVAELDELRDMEPVFHGLGETRRCLL